MVSRVRVIARSTSIFGIALSLGGCGGCSKKDGPGVSDAGATAAADASGAARFEGEIAMHVTSTRARIDQDVTYAVKGNKVRIATPAQGRPTFRTIYDLTTHGLITVLDESHAFTSLTLRPDLTADGGAKERWQAKRLETTGHIADHDCIDWEARLGQRTAVVCVTGEKYFDLAKLGTAAPVQQPWLDALDGFPLRSVERDEFGNEVTKSEVTRIVPHPLDDALFVIPKGYRQIEADSPNVSSGRLRK
jgi:hypothetical protein